MSNLKQDFDEELSQLIKKYEKEDLSQREIADSLQWHYELAESNSQPEFVPADD